MPRSTLLRTIGLAIGGFHVAFGIGIVVIARQVDLSVLYYPAAYLFGIVVLAGIVFDELRRKVAFEDGSE